MITYKDWSIFLTAVSLFLTTPLKAFQFDLSHSSIQVGQSTVLTLTLPNSNPGLQPVLFEDLLTQHKELKLLERRTNQTPTQYEWMFEITAHKTGTFQIPPIQVQLGPNTFSTTALPLTVTTTRAAQDNAIRPEFEALKNPFPWKKLFNAVTWGIVLGFVFWLLVRIFKRFPWAALKNLAKAPKMPSFETDKMWLKKEIKKIRQSLAKSDEPDPEIVDSIVRTLRIFLKRRTQLPATSWTSFELNHKLPLRFRERDLKTVFFQSDTHQFATPYKKNTKTVAESLLNHIEKEFL